MSETVIPIASTPSTRRDDVCANILDTDRAASAKTTKRRFEPVVMREFMDGLPCQSDFLGACGVGGRNAEPRFQVISHTQCVRHNGQRRIYRGARREEAT